MPDQPLVSIIVPTRNSAATVRTCLESICSQSYRALEVILVDNYSTDGTPDLATGLCDIVVTWGHERSAQVNHGVALASGEYVFRVDADFVLQPAVVAECVALMKSGAGAVVVHNTPDPSISYLARLRKFEVDMYKYSLDHSAARFLSRALFQELGGYRDDLIAGEDYDFQNRLAAAGVRIAFADSEAIHLGEPTHLLPLLKKYFAYGVDLTNYYRYNSPHAATQLGFFRRDYFRQRSKFLQQPVLGVGFLLYHTLKYAAGGAGFFCGTLHSRFLTKLGHRSPS